MYRLPKPSRSSTSISYNISDCSLFPFKIYRDRVVAPSLCRLIYTLVLDPLDPRDFARVFDSISRALYKTFMHEILGTRRILGYNRQSSSSSCFDAPTVCKDKLRCEARKSARWSARPFSLKLDFSIYIASRLRRMNSRTRLTRQVSPGLHVIASPITRPEQ